MGWRVDSPIRDWAWLRGWQVGWTILEERRGEGHMGHYSKSAAVSFSEVDSRIWYWDHKAQARGLEFDPGLRCLWAAQVRVELGHGGG